MSQTLRQLSIRGYSPGDENDILALNLEEYGPKHVVVTPEAFHWRYNDNPAGQADLTLVRDDVNSRIVGFTWTIPMRMRLFGNDYLAALTANQLIQPAYRDSLAYAKLLRHRLKRLHQLNIPFRFNFPIESLYARTGSIEKMSSFLIPLLIRPLNLNKLIHRYIKQPLVKKPLGWGGQAIAPILFHPQSIEIQQNPLMITWLVQFDERFDEFWHRVKNKYNIMLIRDRAFLSWRFAPVSGRKYRILAATDNNGLLGYAVIRCTDEIRNIPTGLIMDFLVESGPRGEVAGMCLMEEVWKYFKAEKVWLAGGLAFAHTSEFQIMRRAGYRPLPQRWAPRLFRVAFNSFSNSLPTTADISINDWFITIADYEAH